MKRQPDLNAKKALDEMKLEIGNDLNIKLTNVGKVGGLMTRKLVELGQNQLIEDSDPDTFNPS
ncbi:MAG: alpha/beta-type small acid-soluble spore protein [Tissierellaceae bacterium]